MDGVRQMSLASKFGSKLRDFAVDGNPDGLSQVLLRFHDEAERDDEVYATYLLAKMLESHTVDAKIIQGEGYLSGNVLVSSPEKACSLFEDAAKAGSTRGLYDIGVYYYFDKEFARAIEYLERCLKAGDLDDSKLGLCYGALGDSYSRLPAPQHHKAIENLNVAVTKYHIPYAASRLGEIYMEQSSPNERRKGLAYLEEAAKNGDADAASSLAKLYIYGDEELGITPNRIKAEQLLMPHADSEHVGIQYLLAQMYLFGVSGEDAGGSQGAAKATPPLEKLWNSTHSAVVANKLGLAYYLLGRQREACDMWEYADRENQCSYLDFLGRVYIQDFKDTERGLRCYDRAYRSEGGLANLFVYSEYMELLIKAGRYDEAFAVAVEGESRYNDIEFVYHEAALVLEGKHRTSDPYRYVQMMQACAGYEGYELRARRTLADYYVQIGSSTEARIQLKALYDLGERDAAYNLGVVYGDEPLLAIDWFTKAFEDGNVEAALRIAEIFEKKKYDADKAYEWYSKAANAGSEEGAAEANKFRRTMLGHYKRM